MTLHFVIDIAAGLDVMISPRFVVAFIANTFNTVVVDWKGVV